MKAGSGEDGVGGGVWDAIPSAHFCNESAEYYRSVGLVEQFKRRQGVLLGPNVKRPVIESGGVSTVKVVTEQHTIEQPLLRKDEYLVKNGPRKLCSFESGERDYSCKFGKRNGKIVLGSSSSSSIKADGGETTVPMQVDSGAFCFPTSEYAQHLVSMSITRKRKRLESNKNNNNSVEDEGSLRKKRVVQTVGLEAQLVECGRTGNKRRAKKILELMKAEGHEHLASAVRHVLHECIVRGSKTGVVDILLQVHKDNGLGDLITPNCRYGNIGAKTGRPTQPLSLLAEAVRYKVYPIAEMLLEAGFDPSFQMASNCTCLMVAAYKNDVRMMDLLIKYGADLYSEMSNHVTAFSVACYRGNLEAVKFLAGQGVDVNRQNPSGLTALMTAIQHGHTAVVEFLLEKGADVNICKENGSSPVIVAVRHDQPHLIPILAKHNANPDLRLSNGATAILLAAANGNLQCIKELLAMGADVSLKLPNGADVMAYACHRGYFEIVAHILQKHEKLYAGMSLLKYIRIVERRGFEKIIMLFTQVYSKAMRPIHYAAAVDDVPETVRLMREKTTPFCHVLMHHCLKFAGENTKPYLERGMQHLSHKNKDLWPVQHQKVADALFLGRSEKLSSDVLSHMLSFCGRDWFPSPSSSS